MSVNAHAPGKHLLLDLYGAENLSDINHVKSTLEKVAKDIGATILDSTFHSFGEGSGVTGVVVLGESHISAHTWPETNFAALDVFVCGATDAEKAIKPIQEGFKPKRTYLRTEIRGEEEGISHVVVTCDSHETKGFSVRHTLKSLVEQDYPKDKTEIILVENSRDKSRALELRETVDRYNQQHPGLIKIIDNPQSLPVAEARNQAVQQARYPTISFSDDDILLVDKESLSKIAKYACVYKHGYGAIRHWTNDNTFQQRSSALLSGDEIIELGKDTNIPTEGHLSKTFIANFGFCRKEDFLRTGGFEDFGSYGYEDDALMFKLYRDSPHVKILDDINVVHVNHPSERDDTQSRKRYQEFLMRDNVFDFDVIALFNGQGYDPIEPLKADHHSEKIVQAYQTYKKLIPLDIQCAEDAEQKADYWKGNYQYGFTEYSRRVSGLFLAKDLDTFVKESESDFDNLGLVFQSAADAGLVSVSPEGQLKTTFQYQHAVSEQHYPITQVHANAAYNQFPCDAESAQRRINLLKEKYPFAEYMRVGFVGDDDQVSVHAATQPWIQPVVIERDPAVVDLLRKGNERSEIYTGDIREIDQSGIGKFATFFVDPPYTVDGALAFIAGALKATDFDHENEREFYAILNPTIMGKGMYDLFSTLGRNGINVVEARKNFSAYKLPEHFDEKARAQKLLAQYGVKTDALSYSSSSNLYVFKARNPDIKGIERAIRAEKIYEHYGR
tara:strand:+ start:42535 stop:44718 length:2184 start_codon:yes stop_codon:yes gene_type:complete